MIFDLTDFTDSITIKMFLREDQEADADEAIKQGKFIKLKGITTIDRFDGELTVGSITGIKKCEDFYHPAGGQRAGEAGGAPLSYENERHGRRF